MTKINACDLHKSVSAYISGRMIKNKEGLKATILAKNVKYPT